MAKTMRELIAHIHWVLIGLVTLGIFACRSAIFKKPIGWPTTKIDSFDPVCGDSVVIWHIHLQEGFDFDTIRFVVNTDTFPDYSIPDHPHPWIVAKSGNNGCTSIYFSCYKYEGETKIFVKNMPYFNEVTPIDRIDQNNVNLKVIINGNVIDFEASLAYYRFFGLNYDSKSRSLAVLKEKSCFECR